MGQPAPAPATPAPITELNTLLMHATFMITGKSRADASKTSGGTVFVMGLPRKGDPTDSFSYYVLVTAAHVLDDIGADDAFLLVRRKNPDGTYAAFSYRMLIRDNAHPRYVKHANADVAAMYVDLPNDTAVLPLIPPSFLADDKTVEELELHPGDEVFCLGFPLFAAGAGGFPILRTGHIASYPLTPMKNVKQILLDLNIFGGNSGGPVYFYYTNRIVKGVLHLATYNEGILGLVIQQGTSSVPEYLNTPLNLGVVVPAPFIRETMDMLPPHP